MTDHEATPSLIVDVRKALSDLADAATRGATGKTHGFMDEMRTINTAYAAGLAALKELESGRA